MIQAMEDSLSRLQLLVGPEGIARLQHSRVLLCGVGGVGSWAAEALIRAGVGHLCLVDYDTIRPSNLNRQLHALHSTLGQPKVEAMGARLRDINPAAEIAGRRLRLTPALCPELLQEQAWTYVIDAIDERPAKIALLHGCLTAGIPVISSMGSANKLLSGAVRVGDISETSGCPVAQYLRKQLRRLGIERGLAVVYSPELPVRLSNGDFAAGDHEQAGEKRPLGTIAYLPALFGLRCAATVLEQIIGAAAYSRRGD